LSGRDELDGVGRRHDLPAGQGGSGGHQSAPDELREPTER
jgi:hypothetical protein